jgi:catechol 2,3-dioxygenase-like lactoylglutathione lyase family enzyme
LRSSAKRGALRRIPVAPPWKIGQASAISTIDLRRQGRIDRRGGRPVFSKINHVAIVSENYAQLAQFYEAVFGMQTSAKTRPGRAVTVGDGYVGLNINPRRAGRSAGLDHFGIQVDDCETAFERMRKSYPSVKWLKRPSNRPFAGITTHDPDGNVFDISQKDMANRTSIYVENDGKANPRHINHVAMRTLRPDAMAQFYRDVFELAPSNVDKQPGDANHYLSDGHVTLVIMPWDITDYDATGIITPGMDHIGFKVENLESFKMDVKRIADDNPRLAPAPVGTGKEGAALAKLFERSCSLGQHCLADPDGILIDVMAD